jgi:hypothetical protein
MGRKFKFVLATCSLILGVFFATVFYQTRFSPLAEAQESNQQTSKKWEYCSVYPYNGISNRAGKSYNSAIVSYARADGYSSETIEAATVNDEPNLNFAQNQAFAKAIAKLGEEGWEIIGEGDFREQKVLYFKRPKK